MLKHVLLIHILQLIHIVQRIVMYKELGNATSGLVITAAFTQIIHILHVHAGHIPASIPSVKRIGLRI